MYTVSLCPEGMALHAARRDSDHLAPVGRRSDSFINVEHNVAGNNTRGTDARKQEVLDRIFRVRGNYVENCWADQDNITGGAQRQRIGIECMMEGAHLLKYG